MFILKKFSWSEFDTMKSCCKSLQHQPDDFKKIHAIRVSLKKINSVFQLAGFISGEQFALPGSLQKIFKKSGGLRELQVFLCKIFYYKVTNLEFAELAVATQKSIRISAKKFSRLLIKIKMKKASAELEDSFYRIKNCDMGILLNQYENWKKNMLPISIDRKNPESSLHQLRRSIKNLMYIHQALHSDASPDEERNKLNQVQEMLGKWHDDFTYLRFLEKNKITGKNILQIRKNLKTEQKKIIFLLRIDADENIPFAL